MTTDLQWKPIKIQLGKIKPWSNNPRMSTKAQAERIIESEKALGQLRAHTEKCESCNKVMKKK